MFHVVEGFGQLGHFRLTGRRQVGRVELAPGDLPGGADHLLHRGQQRQHREGHDAASARQSATTTVCTHFTRSLRADTVV